MANVPAQEAVTKEAVENTTKLVKDFCGSLEGGVSALVIDSLQAHYCATELFRKRGIDRRLAACGSGEIVKEIWERILSLTMDEQFASLSAYRSSDPELLWRIFQGFLHASHQQALCSAVKDVLTKDGALTLQRAQEVLKMSKETQFVNHDLYDDEEYHSEPSTSPISVLTPVAIDYSQLPHQEQWLEQTRAHAALFTLWSSSRARHPQGLWLLLHRSCLRQTVRARRFCITLQNKARWTRCVSW